MKRAESKFPLPGKGEQRFHLNRMALRFALYGNAPMQERTMEAVAAKFGLERGSFERAWYEDGIEERQAELMGLVPAGTMSQVAGPRGMGDVERADAERRAREGQIATLQTARSKMESALESLPARIANLEIQQQATNDPNTIANLAAALVKVRQEASRLISDIRQLNGMLAEATGLDAVQTLSLAAAKAATKQRPPTEQPHGETRGVIVEL